MAGIADLRRTWPDRVFIDEAEVMRLEDVQVYVLPFFFWFHFIFFLRKVGGCMCDV